MRRATFLSAMTARLGLAVAAGIFLLIVGVRVLRRAPRTEHPDAGAIAVVQPTARSTASVPRFTWHSVPMATAYELRLLTARGDSVFTIMTTDTTYLVRSTALTPGADYVWSVRAIIVGETRAASPTTRFRFQP
jgi:hypothetical protein